METVATIHIPDNQIYFEPVSKYANMEIDLPVRKTTASAGYDIAIAEDRIIYPYDNYMELLRARYPHKEVQPYSLDEVAAMTKETLARPTLISTGLKCHMPKDVYLELSVRSSTPLKNWIILANGVGIIDADYYNNSDNEGEIFFQLINISPFPILLRRGEVIGQGIFKPYLTTNNDVATRVRTGGFGSTSNV